MYLVSQPRLFRRANNEKNLPFINFDLLLTASILAEVFPVENLIERALEIAPSLKSALLSIEDAEIELKRAMYNEASLSKNTLNLRRKLWKMLF